MITSIKSNNSGLYKDLFAKASELLSGYKRVQTFDADKDYYYKDSNTNAFVKYEFEATTESAMIYEFAEALTEYGYLFNKVGEPADGFVPEIGITTLEEYYNWLPEIKRDAEGKPTIFTKLPLDEAHFEINANTRAITIPADFKKNGIGVQGDDLAEVVYFMIDRYYDAMDLNNTEIFIEWETPKGKSGTITKSVSETYLKIIDDELYPGKLIFGWAISDAITKDSGTLKFAVRFVQWADSDSGKKELVYSFNTLTAQVTINPNLGLDLEKDTYEIDNANDRLLERIEPGEVVGGAQAMVPYYLTNIQILADGYDLYTDGEYDAVNGTYTLQVVATADDTGAVSYVWKRADLDEHNISDDSWIEIPNSNQVAMFALTEDELKAVNYVLPDTHNYYISNDEGSTYQPLAKGNYDLKNVEEFDFGNRIPTIYEQRGYLVVNQWGQYRAEARNRIFNSLTKKNSEIATFKRPDAIVMDNSNQTVDKHILGQDSAILNPVYTEVSPAQEHAYQWYRADEKRLLSELVAFTDTPDNTKISFGSDKIRIMVPKDTVYHKQNVGPTGDPNNYYITMKVYAPEGAVSFEEGECGVNDPDTALRWDTKINLSDAPHGSDNKGVHRTRWLAVAKYDPSTGVWSYYAKNKGENEYIGWKYKIRWYDKNDKLIEESPLIVTQLANEINYNATENFFEVDGATTKEFTAIEPGIYQLNIKRIRNKAEIENKSIEYRVTNAPITPTWTNDTYDGAKQIFVTSLIAGDEALTVNWENTEADEFYVVWKLYRQDQKEDDLTIYTQKVENNVNTHSFNPTDDMFKNIFEVNNEDYEGLYYAQVATKLNGVMSDYSEVPATTVMFTVIGSKE